MTHAFARRSRDTGDETHHRLGHVVFDPACAALFVVTADLAYHDHCIRIRVVVEHPHDIDVLQTVDRITANTDAGRLPDVRQLTHGFVGQGTGTRYDANPALLVNMPGHDADLDFVRRNDPWTVGADQHGAFALHCAPGCHHVANRHALRYTDDEIELGVHCLVDCGSSERRWNVDDGDCCACLRLGLLHRCVDRNPFEALPGFVGIDAGHKARAAIGILAA